MSESETEDEPSTSGEAERKRRGPKEKPLPPAVMEKLKGKQ